MSIFICCCCFQYSPPSYLNQNEAYFLQIDKQAFIYDHSNVEDAFDSREVAVY